MWGKMASCGGLATRLLLARACASHPVSIALRATEGDENPPRPIANRPQDAILPHKRPSGAAYTYT
jgi:hypothetical protein